MEEQGLLDSIKSQIEKQVNEEFTKYKEQCLQELEYKIEAKRNQIIGNMLDGISIYIQNREEYTNIPAINIRIETKPIIRCDTDKGKEVD